MYIPFSKDRLMISTNGLATLNLMRWKMFVGMLVGPRALLELNVLITLTTSILLVGLIKKVAGFSFFRK